MKLKWLTLLIIGLLLLENVRMMRKGICSKPIVKTDNCRNGTKSIQITAFVRNNGICTPLTTRKKVHCDTKRKNTCKCSAFGDPHYRTYDGQVIHFYGDCKYTLSKYNEKQNPCSFNVEVQNEYRYDNKYFTYTKSVVINFQQDVYELGKHRILKINNERSSVPFEKEDIKIFNSRKFMHFVSARCSLRVAFDGDSNAFVEVSKQYARKMSGICGDCNGIKDDLKTKYGQDVSDRKDKFLLIGNSYNVSSAGKICKSARNIVYDKTCGRDWITQMKDIKFCGIFLERHNPFTSCHNHGHVDLRNFYHECLTAMCVYKNRPKKLQKTKCKMLSGIAEVCGEAGFVGKRWRTKCNCQKHCCENQYFTDKPTTCPMTCENYFYGKKNPCYDWPEREGCECKPGFIRDGQSCVKPMHCKCINLCVDREKSERCQQWKQKGLCKTFYQQMRIICPRTCGTCKRKKLVCSDVLSTKKCVHFRKQGLCLHEFYRAACGLTCNYDKCRCDKPKTIVGPCNKVTNIQTTTNFVFARDSNGVCAKIITTTNTPCDCRGFREEKGSCNFCTGKRKITQFIKEVVNDKCVQSTKVIHENCSRCPKNSRIKRECHENRISKKTIIFNKLDGCNRCVTDRKIKRKEIKCENTRKVVLEKSTCLNITSITIRKPQNCRCEETVIKKVSVWCCNQQTVRMPPICKDGKIIHRTITYKLSSKGCIPVHHDRVETPKCILKKKFQKGKCERYRNGQFFCKAIDFKRVMKIDHKCRCKEHTVKRRRTCCCRPPRKHKTCHRLLGIKTTITTSYSLMRSRRGYECIEQVNRVSIKMDTFKDHYITIPGKCQSDCFKRNKITRKFRYGCLIKTEFVRDELEPCCCIPHTLKKSECVDDHVVKKKYKRVIMNNRCTNVLVSRKKRSVICPRPAVTKSQCTYPQHRRRVTVVSHVLNKCRCERKETSTLKQCPDCKVKEYRREMGKCDIKTCTQVITIFFRNAKCQKVTKTQSRTCCCRSEKRSSSHCDQSTGTLYNTVRWYEFLDKFSICTEKSNKISTKLSCKQKEVINGKCGEIRKGFIQVKIKRQFLNKLKCKCSTRKHTIWKPCGCPGVEVVSRKCRVNHWYIKEVSYRLNARKSECVREERVREDRIVCPSFPKSRKEKITRCHYRLITEKSSPVNCRCEKKRSYETFYDCCHQKTETIAKCDKTRIITEKTSFSPSADRRKCISFNRKSSVEISCNKYVKKSRTRCRGYHYYKIKTFYGVQNCKCVKLRTERKKITCRCKIIPEKTICLNKAFVTTTVTNTLSRGRCLTSSKRRESPIKCPQSKETRSTCNHETGLITVKKLHYDIKNCKCVPKVSHHKVYCPCYKKDRIKKGFCDENNKRKIDVFKYVRLEEKCRWSLSKSYSEDCVCPKPTSIKNCVKDSIFETKTIDYHLRRVNVGIELHRCIKSVSKTRKELVCNRGHSEEVCIAHRRVETRCFFNRLKCKCQKHCERIERGPCECEKLDRVKEECINNVKYSVHLKYRAGKKQCKMSRKEFPIREIHPKSRTKCESCSIHMNNGVFKSCRTTTYSYVNCRLREDVKTSLILCHCHKNQVSRPKCIGNINVVTKTNFYKKDNKCVSHQTAYNLKIDCQESRVASEERRCSTKYTASYYEIENCRCVKRVLAKENSKCCQPSSVKKICRKNKWINIHKTYHQKLTQMKLFPELKSSIMATYCHVRLREYTKFVRCRSGYTTETCDPKTDKLKKEKHLFIPINCKCKHKVAVTYDKCKQCPKKNIIRSECGPRERDGKRYFDITITKWKKMVDNSCKKIISTAKEVCECPPAERKSECTRGQNVFMTISYDINTSPPCLTSVKKRTESVPCYNNGVKNRWVHVRTSRCSRPGQYTIKYFERLKYDSRKCSCRKVSKSVKTKMCCHPCKISKRCRNNHKEIISKCEIPLGLRCESKVDIKRIKTKCPKTVQKVVGGCKGTTITYHKTKYTIQNCQCQKKTQTISIKKLVNLEQCINNVMVVTVYMYESTGEKCVSKPPIKQYHKTVCPTVIRIKDKKLSECKFLRSHYGQTSVNCKCQDTLIRTETLNYKCCEEDTVSRKCVSDSTMVITRTNYDILDFKCFPESEVSRVLINCKEYPAKRIVTGKCTYKIIHYSSHIKNCKCQKKVRLIQEKESCCDHRKQRSEYQCDKQNGREIFTKIFYTHLSTDKCVKRRKVDSRAVNCKRMTCSKEEGPCRKNTMKIKMFCYRSVDCKCVKTLVNEYNQCCGKRFTWIRRGHCDKHRKYFIRVRYFALIFHKSTNKCQAVVRRTQFIRCRCPAPFVKKRCTKDALITLTQFSYKLKSKSCHLISTEKQHLFERCPKRTKIIINEFCDRETGWKSITFLQTYPRNCQECIQKKIVVKEICVCSKAFPKIKTWMTCDKDRVIIQNRRVPVCNATSAAWIVETLSKPILNCEKTETEVGDCFSSIDDNAVKVRYDTVVQYFLQNCICKRRVVKRFLRHCSCRSPHQTDRCLGLKRVFTSFSYILTGQRCHERIDVKHVKVSCPQKPRIIKSKCDGNKYKITKIKFYIQNCKCLSRKTERFCDCKCKKNSTERVCSGRFYTNVIETTYRKHLCRCVKSQKTIQTEPICPKFISQSIGDCLPGKKASYREIIQRRLKKEYRTCQCRVDELKIKRVCDCPKAEITRKLCIGNQKIKKIFIWKINERKNECEKYLKSVFRRSVKCLPNTSNRVCNKETGLGREITVTYHVKDCKCVESKKVKLFRCKCDKSRKLINLGTCSGRPSCQRTDFYKEIVLRDEKCVYVTIKITKPCCCPKAHKRTICRNNKLMTKETKYRLINGQCVRNEVETCKCPLKCPGVIRKVVGVCPKDKYRTIFYTKHTLRNCQCVKEKVKIVKKKCPCTRDKVTVTCHRREGYIKRVVIKCQPIKCKCGPMINVVKQSVSCPKDSFVQSACIKKPGTIYSVSTTTRIRYHLDHKCKCVPERTVSARICKCQRKRVQKVQCDEKRHMLISTISVNRLKNGQCTRVKLTKSQSVKCNGIWKVKSESGCLPRGSYGIKYKSFTRLVHDGCRCKEVVLTASCHCACSGPESSSRCVEEKFVHHTFIYKIVNCKCTRHITSTTSRSPECEKHSHKVGGCRIENGKCVRYTTYRESYTINCKCHIRTREEKSSCQTCSVPPKKEITCNKKTNQKVIVNTWYQIMSDGVIKENIERKIQNIQCFKIADCQQITKCNKQSLTQTFQCSVRGKENCECIRRTKTITRPCECWPRKTQRGKCNKDTCIREIKIIKSHLTILRDGKEVCEKETRVIKQKCCCPKSPDSDLACHNNRLIKKIVIHIFNAKLKGCVRTEKLIDKTPPCFPKVKTNKGHCDRKTCLRSVKFTFKKLLNCQCEKTDKTVFHKCCCLKKDHITTECHGITSVTLQHVFRFRNKKCHKRVIRKETQVVCPQSKRISQKCNEVTGIRTIRIYGYRLKNCLCVPKISVVEKICRCKLPNQVLRTCLKERGIIRITQISYRLDIAGNKCEKIVVQKDRQISCLNIQLKGQRILSRRKSCGLCNHQHHYGTYKRCSSIRKVRKGCFCEDRVTYKYRLCHCDKSRTFEQCHENKNILKTIEYVRERSNNKKYRFRCSRKEKITPGANIVCRGSRVVVGKCIDNFRTYTSYSYVAVSCKCIEKIKMHRTVCSCPKRKEISRQCLEGSIIKKTIRSYKLVCDKKHIPTCQCIHVDNSFEKRVRCPDDTFNEVCLKKVLVRSWTMSVVRNCKCISKTHNDYKPDCGKPRCSDILSKQECNNIKKFQKCHQMNIYSQFLCQLTCGYCEKCRRPKVDRYLTQCKCKRINGHKICSRSLIIIYYVSRSRKCLAVRRQVEVFCGCFNRYSKAVCRKAAKQGECSKPSFKKNCAYRCNPKCRFCGRNKIFRRCVQDGPNQGKYEVLEIRFIKFTGFCLFTRKTSFQGTCKICDKTVRKVVLGCYNAERVIVTKYVEKQPNGACINKEKKVIYSCKDCCRDVKTRVGLCNNGYRSVRTIYWVVINGHCSEERIINQYSCNAKCSGLKIFKSQCLFNLRVEKKTWFSGENCFPHHAYEMASCNP